MGVAVEVVLGNGLAAAAAAFIMAFVYNELYRFTSRRLLAPAVVGAVVGLAAAALSYVYILPVHAVPLVRPLMAAVGL